MGNGFSSRSHRAFRTALGLAALLSFWLPAAEAGADVVSPPPDSCFEGSVPNSCHGGPYCAPHGCTDQSACQPGEVCEDTALCILEIDCGGMGGPWPQDSVTGLCPGGAACTQGQCETVKVCVPQGGTGGSGTGGSTTSTSTSTSTTGTGGAGTTGSGDPIVVEQGCGCRLDGRPAAGFWALLLAAAAAIRLCRRARRG